MDPTGLFFSPLSMASPVSLICLGKMPYFRREGHPGVTPQAFLDFVGNHLSQQAFSEMPVLTGEELPDAAMAKKSTAGGLDGWAWNEVKALSLSWFVGLGLVLPQIETAVKWPRFALLIFRNGFVFSAGKGVPSVDAGFPTLDIEEILSDARQGDFQIFVADVVKSFDTVDRDILDSRSTKKFVFGLN